MSATTPLPFSPFPTLTAEGSPDSRDVALAKRGDRSAFERLVRRYKHEVFNAAYGFLRHIEDAEDAVQEVFLRAHLGLARFEGRASFRTWLLRIASNTSATLLARQRAKKRNSKVISLSGDVDPISDTNYTHAEHHPHFGRSTSRCSAECPSERAEERELHAAVSRAVDHLEPEHRTVFLLRVEHGESYRDIARRLGAPVGTIKSKLHRARTALREGLRGYFGE